MLRLPSLFSLPVHVPWLDQLPLPPRLPDSVISPSRRPVRVHHICQACKAHCPLSICLVPANFLNLYEPAGGVDPRSPQAMIDETVAAAKKSDVVVTVVGGAQGMGHEASSRTGITISQSQLALIKL